MQPRHLRKKGAGQATSGLAMSMHGYQQQSTQLQMQGQAVMMEAAADHQELMQEFDTKVELDTSEIDQIVKVFEGISGTPDEIRKQFMERYRNKMVTPLDDIKRQFGQ